MSENDFGEIENDDIPQYKPRQNNQIRKQSVQEDEFEYFDEQDDNQTQKKPLELPKIDQNKGINYSGVSSNNKSTKKVNNEKPIEIKNLERQQVIQPTKPKPQMKQESDNDLNEDIYEDESRITNSRKPNPNEKYHQEEEIDDIEIDNDEDVDLDGGSQYEEYQYEQEDQQKDQKRKEQVQNDDEEPDYEEDYEENDFDEENQDEFDDQPSKFEDDQSKISADYRQRGQKQRQGSQQSSMLRDRPPVYKRNKAPPKQTYIQKYSFITEEVNYEKLNDKQLMRENTELRQKLKEISDEVSKLVEKAASKPKQLEKKNMSIMNKIKILKEELKNNQKRLEPQQAEINKIRSRIEQVSSPKYFTDLTKDIEKVVKQIEETKKKNKQDLIEQNRKGKNLDMIENVIGNPQNFVDKQKKAIDLDVLERKNENLQDQIVKIRVEIAEQQQKQPKISQILQDKIDQAVKLKIDVDSDQQMQKMRDKYHYLEKKKFNLEKHLDMMRQKEGKVQAAEHEVRDLKRLIQQKNNDINQVEMQIFEQRRQVEEARNKFPENKYKLFSAAALTQQNYNYNYADVDQPQQKNTRKLASAKPIMQNKPPAQYQIKQENNATLIQEKKNISPRNAYKTETSMPIEELQIQIEPQIIKTQTDISNQNPQTLNQAVNEPETNQYHLLKGPSKPFNLKKNTTNNPNITEPVNQQQSIQLQTSFGQQSNQLNQFTLNEQRYDEKDQTAKFVIGQQEPNIVNLIAQNKVSNDSMNQENLQQPRRMVRMAKKPEENISLYQPVSQTIQPIQQQNLQAQSSSYINQSDLPVQQSNQTTKQSYQLSQQPQQSTNDVNLPLKNEQGYGMTNAEQGQPRRNRMMRNTNQDQIDTYEPSTKLNPSQQQAENLNNNSNVPNLNKFEEQPNLDQSINVSVNGRNRNQQKQTSQINQQPQVQNQSQNYKLNEPIDNINQNIIQVEQKTEQKQFNFNKNQKVPQQEQVIIQQQPAVQVQQTQGQGRRQNNGPRKLDIWNDDQQTDVQNIKTIDESQSKPVQQQKIKIIEEEPSYKVEQDREMTLDEILGNGSKNSDSKPLETYQPKRGKLQVQQTQAEKQKEFVNKAENDDFFGDYEV